MDGKVDAPVRLTSLSPGAGCACKLPLAALDQLITSVSPALTTGSTAGAGPETGTGTGTGTGSGTTAPAAPGEELLIGLVEGDDAAVLRLDDERALIVTTDFFTPIV